MQVVVPLKYFSKGSTNKVYVLFSETALRTVKRLTYICEREHRICSYAVKTKKKTEMITIGMDVSGN